MNRALLVVAALVVLGGAIGLWLMMRAPDDAQARARGAAGSGAEVATPTVREPSTPGSTVTPSLSRDPGQAAETPTSEYVVGDTRVRDHRGGEHKPIDVPPNAHPPDTRQVSSGLTTELSTKLQAVMSECVAQIPKEARGPKPRLEGQVMIAIKDHQVAVSKSLMVMRDVTGEAVAPAIQCIEQKSLTITNAAPDEGDVDNYSINVSFAVR